ncbi:MAG: FHA domain-containing protein [Planctomycetia bacterium]
MHRPEDTSAAREPPTTLLESFDSWAQLLRHGEPPAPSATPSSSGVAAVSEAEPYRPTLRRPLALLHVIDDGREDGETIRLRGDRLAIGRTDGDVTIPHDITMSTRHALLECDTGTVWQLSDVGSAGGTFVRVLSARLHHGSCFELGASRFRFDIVDGEGACLIELQPDGDGVRHPLRGPVTTVGRVGSACDIGVVDPFVSPLHAEVRSAAGGWRIENRGLNGLWVRITGPVRLAHPSQFKCGEQRFVFVPLTS